MLFLHELTWIQPRGHTTAGASRTCDQEQNRNVDERATCLRQCLPVSVSRLALSSGKNAFT